jgi:hypothetical protein
LILLFELERKLPALKKASSSGELDAATEYLVRMTLSGLSLQATGLHLLKNGLRRFGSCFFPVRS